MRPILKMSLSLQLSCLTYGVQSRAVGRIGAEGVIRHLSYSASREMAG